MNLRSLAFLFLLSPLAAQEGTAPRASVAHPPAVTVTLSFPGGTIAEFVDLVRQMQPKANIVVATDAVGAKLPPMDLRGAGLEQALEGACAVAVGDAQIRMKEFRGAGESVFTIVAAGPGTAAKVQKTDSAALRTEVYSLNPLLDQRGEGSGIASTTVLSAIEVALGDDAAQATLRFHPESGLLVLRARIDQISLVRNVLENLQQDVERRRHEAQHRPPSPARDEKGAEKAPSKPK